MSDREIRRLLRRNIRRHGPAVELIKLAEECSELAQAVCKLVDGGKICGDRVEALAEEMADVEICMEQVRMIFPNLEELEDRWTERKLRRLRLALDKDGGGGGRS